MFRIEYSRRAKVDVEEIGLRIEADRGESAAAAYLAAMREKIGTLSEMPRRTRERTEIGPGQHALILGPYLVFYKVIGNEVVYIQRVIRGSRPIKAGMLKD